MVFSLEIIVLHEGRSLQMHTYLRYCLHIVDTVQYST